MLLSPIKSKETFQRSLLHKKNKNNLREIDLGFPENPVTHEIFYSTELQAQVVTLAGLFLGGSKVLRLDQHALKKHQRFICYSDPGGHAYLLMQQILTAFPDKKGIFYTNARKLSQYNKSLLQHYPPPNNLKIKPEMGLLRFLYHHFFPGQNYSFGIAFQGNHKNNFEINIIHEWFVTVKPKNIFIAAASGHFLHVLHSYNKKQKKPAKLFVSASGHWLTKLLLKMKFIFQRKVEVHWSKTFSNEIACDKLSETYLIENTSLDPRHTATLMDYYLNTKTKLDGPSLIFLSNPQIKSRQ